VAPPLAFYAAASRAGVGVYERGQASWVYVYDAVVPKHKLLIQIFPADPVCLLRAWFERGRVRRESRQLAVATFYRLAFWLGWLNFGLFHFLGTSGILRPTPGGEESQKVALNYAVLWRVVNWVLSCRDWDWKGGVTRGGEIAS